MSAWASLRDRLFRPVDAASLAAFRIVFGLLACVASARFLVYGWVDTFFGQPTFFFSYYGLGELITVPSVATLEVLFGVMAVLGLMIAAGLFYRIACVAFFLIFTYVELLDVTYYLNHYYLVSLIAGLLCFLPLHRAYSLDALRKPELRVTALPAWVLTLLRVQVGVVYVFAALAKAGSDWLIHAQPLNIWLSSRVDTPLIGPWLDLWWVALVASWAGFLNDLLVVPLLLWKRSRPYAYAMVVVFHIMTGLFFNIGMFPFIMLGLATVFFDPAWPRRFFRRGREQALGSREQARWLGPTPIHPNGLHAPGSSFSPPSELARGRSGKSHPRMHAPVLPSPARRQAITAAVMLYAAVQILVPLRSHIFYEGDVIWHEQGMRWSWKVMLREKNGAVTYRVRIPGEARERYVYPGRYLTPYQEREMSGQPDLILQLAHHIGHAFEARGYPGVEVRVDAMVSLNGRPLAPLVDPEVDLMQVEDGVAPADWILPQPSTPPIRLQPRALASSSP